MAEELSPISPSSPSYTVGSPSDDDRREKTKEKLPNENKKTNTSKDDKDDKQHGLFDEFV